ncbi:hypothetical protein SAMN05216223_12523 [Actinacidiphila yanglinensis]|uniref:Uncharacterized protein n=1 Tax=Actinacidiphila yanglinensis TaxID=310779 RepID=A0A1H6E336_9ACTN|nr:hypothetical protein SAMN05216223_12523 [Actinacidiphila yanglinensis]
MDVWARSRVMSAVQFAGDVSPRSGCRHTANRVAGSRERAADFPLPRRVLYTLREAGSVSIEAAAPLIGAHLRASPRTGRLMRYQPDAGGPAGWGV